MTSTAGRAIDAHVHVWTDDALRYPFGPHDGLAPPSTPFPLAVYWDDSRAAEVDRAVLVQPRIYGYDHAYLFDVARAFPDTVRVVPLVNVARNDAVATLRALAAHPQTAAFRVIALGHAPADWLCSPSACAVWEAAAELALPVSFLIDSPQLPVVARVASTHPTLAVIIDHMGRCTPRRQPEWSSALYSLAGDPGVHIKLSATDALSDEGYPYRDMWPLIRRLYSEYGPDRLLWGSDWPHQKAFGAYPRSRTILQHVLADAAPGVLDKIYQGTGARLYRFPQRTDEGIV